MKQTYLVKYLIEILLALLALCFIAPYGFEILGRSVPITLQTLIILTIAMVLRPNQTFNVLMIYLFLGALGLKVFAGFGGGYERLIGENGGFLWAFPFVGYILSLNQEWYKGNIVKMFIAALTAHIGILLIGYTWRYFVMGEIYPNKGILIVASIKSIGVAIISYLILRFRNRKSV